MIPATRSLLHDSFERSTYERIGSFISIPDDIIKISLVSHLFHDWMREGALRAFFITNHKLIERVGYYPTSSHNYENFKNLFLLLKNRYIQTCYEIYGVHPKKCSLQDILGKEQLVELCSRNSFARWVFPSLQHQLPSFRVMAFPRRQEASLQTHERLWRWLKQQPYEIPTITWIFSVILNRNFQLTHLTILPFEITYFSHLQTLTLIGHQLKLVPSFLNRLKKLKGLFLRFNLISEVYCPFKNMPDLKEIDLTRNCLRALPPPCLFERTAPFILYVDLHLLALFEQKRTFSVFVHYDFQSQSIYQAETFVKLAHHVAKNLIVIGKIAQEREERSELIKLVGIYFRAWALWKESANLNEFSRTIHTIQHQAYFLIKDVLKV